MPALRVLIVDDEPLARDRIRSLLAGEDDVAVIGECADGASAVASIERDAPDLVVLDVQLPDMDGFRVLASLDVAQLPAVVFVTAFDQYALHAFDVHAVDYLLKPVGRERFRAALRRVRESRRSGDTGAAHAGLIALLGELQGLASKHDRLTVRHDGRLIVVRVADIDWVEAAANYVRLHARGGPYVMRDTMKRMEERLPKDRFVRIHRSAIVNFDRVREVQPWFHGEYIALLTDGTKLTIGRAYVPAVNAFMG